MKMTSSNVEGALIELHTRLAARQNASTATVEGAAQLRLPLPQAISLALGTMGGAHAPIRATYNHQKMRNERFAAATEQMLLDGQTIPGYGSAFVKDQPDPLIGDFIMEYLSEGWQADIAERTVLVQIATGCNIYPNAALVSAVSALAILEDASWAEACMVRGRMNPWIWTYQAQDTKF